MRRAPLNFPPCEDVRGHGRQHQHEDGDRDDDRYGVDEVLGKVGRLRPRRDQDVRIVLERELPVSERIPPTVGAGGPTCLAAGRKEVTKRPNVGTDHTTAIMIAAAVAHLDVSLVFTRRIIGWASSVGSDPGRCRVAPFEASFGGWRGCQWISLCLRRTRALYTTMGSTIRNRIKAKAAPRPGSPARKA